MPMIGRDPRRDPTKEHLNNGPSRELRVGDRVSLDGRVGVLRYFEGPSGAIVRFDGEATTKVVPLHRLVACADEPPLPDG